MSNPNLIRRLACSLCGGVETDTYTCDTCNRPACGCCAGTCEGCGALVCAGCFEPASPLDPGSGGAISVTSDGIRHVNAYDWVEDRILGLRRSDNQDSKRQES
jgi:hypothetical protein